jgi:hypothetical protein
VHVEVPAEQVRVRGSFARVELDRETAVLRLAATVVGGVDDEVDLLVVLPRALPGKHVRAVADRVLTERGHVLERDGRQRVERRVAQAQREVGECGLQGDCESALVDDLEAGEGAVGVVAEALNVGKEGAAQLFVAEKCTVLPGIGEFQAGLDLDRIRRVVVGRDRFGLIVHRDALGVAVDEPGEDRIDDLSAAGFGHVRRKQRVLGLRAVRRDDRLCVARRCRGGCPARGTAGERESSRRGQGDGGQAQSGDFQFLLLYQERMTRLVAMCTPNDGPPSWGPSCRGVS